ncbi:hypothetical protein CHLNCDRAFT_135820 [Chlorella variabilis]|uniref:RING-type domain-containing protein n=1 Tax=Chlorella variabilis TaxID=554065 RepID=E1ZJ26_CHLVA|nr:hypothetical protein CHLNCDRAFT_135820 [Chlorella variabilis]EFN54264.1 hypothetical protein CHLNCDRAFT_135820 [Chlorella variabilis]|eukprot:XP_005846366.1 hypothetical protein CHLNCDRAFT_135820 [Chlorella variabilis]
MRQQQRQRSPQEEADDFRLAKRLQEEEDRRAAAAVDAESRLQRRFRELEAAEAAAEAEEAAAASERGWSGRGFFSGLFGGLGGGAAAQRQRSSSAAAAAASAGGQAPPRAASQGQRSQRGRRGPAAEAEFASAMGHLMPPPYHAGGHGGRSAGYMGDLHSHLMVGLSRGLPADLLLSGRDFTEADYEQLLALDQGNKKKVAPRDRVSQLDTVRVPLAGRGAEAACAGSPELDACSICLEEARPGDEFKVLPCRHAFHCRCIDRWLLSERNSCPVCQREAV